MQLLKNEGLFHVCQWLNGIFDSYPYEHTKTDIYETFTVLNISLDIRSKLDILKSEVILNSKSFSTMSDFEAYSNMVVDNLNDANDIMISKSMDKPTFCSGNHSFPYENYNVICSASEYYDGMITAGDQIINSLKHFFQTNRPMNLDLHSKINKITVPGLRSDHLHVLAFSVYRLTKGKITRKSVSDVLSKCFNSEINDSLSALRIYQGHNNGPTENSMKEVAQILYDLANIIDEEIEENKNGKYFSRTKK